MKADFFNPFLDSFNLAIAKIFGERVKKEKVELINSLNGEENVHIFIGVAGDYEGMMLFTAPFEDAVKIASQITGSNSTELDEHSSQALQKLLSTSAAQAVSVLSQKGIYTYITPPAFVSGEKLNTRFSNSIISVKILVAEKARFSLNFSLKFQEEHSRRHSPLVVKVFPQRSRFPLYK